jgi:hypothetical protein
MKPLDYYHQRAEECLRLACGASAPSEQGVMRELAARWIRLAERAEQKLAELRRGDDHVAWPAASSHRSDRKPAGFELDQGAG